MFWLLRTIVNVRHIPRKHRVIEFPTQDFSNGRIYLLLHRCFKILKIQVWRTRSLSLRFSRIEREFQRSFQITLFENMEET
jgi:hypothetical protein